ncbi:MAG TPA: putative selenate reductase subunit YgfK [Desulfobulbaceae bacterium]|nr:putative selenate reductase subunit YgfK [Desulfobulbaceae bacterium]
MKKDLFVCTDIDTLLPWILSDLKERNEIFGIGRDQFFIPSPNDRFRMSRYGNLLETPLGVASGPHTQLAQNIVTAWLTGCRYIELKTIQVLDELDVAKPCIDMTDEGYNCEWSQELKLDESFNEYLNAFILLYILRDKLGFAGDAPGFIFNMSAGYELQGIHSPTVQRFFDRMEDCSSELAEKIELIAPIYPRIRELHIPSRISDSLTISTMHGCPPDEIEKIARYFIEDRGYHTTIKLNPTLLGPERLRDILNSRLKYPIDVPDLAFEHDLKYPDAVKLIHSLLDPARAKGVEFNIKLTNTLETTNIDQKLPKTEAMCYMSGRALHPISINLAARLQEEFEGTLDLSFCAGIDTFNVFETLTCGMAPITVCSDLLKPGGYARVKQYTQTVLSGMEEAGANSIDQLVCDRAGMEDRCAAALNNLRDYAAVVVESGKYSKDLFPYQNVKIKRPLPRFDCAAAPCVASCAASQDVPRYMDYTARGDFENGYKTILATNPMPNVLGLACEHPCQDKCTRINYDFPLPIREIKRFLAEIRQEEIQFTPGVKNGKKVAIIGAGPSGLSAAFFLRLEGFQVDIYESKNVAGGRAVDALTALHPNDSGLKKDIDRILALGVHLHTGVQVTKEKFGALRESHDFIYIACGAQEETERAAQDGKAKGIIGHLDFIPEGELRVDGKTMQSTLPFVLAGGDVLEKSSLDTAIGHGRRATESIVAACGFSSRIDIAPADERKPDVSRWYRQNATRIPAEDLKKSDPAEGLSSERVPRPLSKEEAITEAARCLQCDLICNICVTVCPNRANVAVKAEPVTYPVQSILADGSIGTSERITLTQAYQVINIPDFCNQCGNCKTFCPTSSAPYFAKSHVHLSEASLKAHGEGFFMAEPGVMHIMAGGKKGTLTDAGETFVFEDAEVKLHLAKNSLEATNVVLKRDVKNKKLRRVAEAAILFALLDGRYPFSK